MAMADASEPENSCSPGLTIGGKTGSIRWACRTVASISIGEICPASAT